MLSRTSFHKQFLLICIKYLTHNFVINIMINTYMLKVAGTPIFAFFYYLISSYQVTKTISTLYCIFIIMVGVLRKRFINIRSTAY